MNLIRLPNGSWVDPETIKSIRPIPTTTCSITGTYRARVCIDHSGYTEVILANDDEHAIQMADEIATMIFPSVVK